ncbi:MAG: 16S rRNA (cytosine(1402)-N(4))-methyltransferase, partial [Planctomycetales bacterium]|nr:16S rRNA (cytosine(1402)-N(4))-methyltransferase [Planctomycetales bacterium]
MASSDPDSSGTIHVSVLLEECIQWLMPQAGGRFVDGTLGGGGHTRALADRVGPTGFVLAIDRDAKAVRAAREWLPQPPCAIYQASFRDLPEVFAELELAPVDGVLLDLGL